MKLRSEAQQDAFDRGQRGQAAERRFNCLYWGLWCVTHDASATQDSGHCMHAMEEMGLPYEIANT